MKKMIMTLSVLVCSVHSQASNQGPCGNYAKYGAIKAYKTAHPGSEALKTESRLQWTVGATYLYQVTLQEASGTGAGYLIKLKTKGKQCSITTVTQIPEKSVCEKLYEKAEQTCTQSMCEEAEQDGFQCEIDGDFHEGLQICAYDEMPELVKSYNAANPDTNLNCDDI